MDNCAKADKKVDVELSIPSRQKNYDVAKTSLFSPT